MIDKIRHGEALSKLEDTGLELGSVTENSRIGNKAVEADKLWCFGGFVLRGDHGILVGADGEVRLRPQAFKLLQELVQEAPKILSADDLLDRVWGAEHLSPTTLRQTVSELRQALGDTAGQPRFIETVHRRGYRFIAPVTCGDSGVVPAVEGSGEFLSRRIPDTSSAASPTALPPITEWPWWLVAVAGLFLLGAVLQGRHQITSEESTYHSTVEEEVPFPGKAFRSQAVLPRAVRQRRAGLGGESFAPAAMQLLRSGRPEEALLKLEKALAKNPHEPFLNDLRTWAYQDLGRFEDAHRSALQVVKLSNHLQPIRRQIADARLSETAGDWARAVETWRRIGTRSGNPEHGLRLALGLRELGHLKAATDLVEALHSGGGADLRLRLLRAQLAWDQEQLDSVDSLLEEWISERAFSDIPGPLLEGLLLWARSLEQQGDLASAAEKLVQAKQWLSSAERAPALAKRMLVEAHLARLGGDTATARDTFHRAAEHFQQWGDWRGEACAQMILAHLELAVGNFDEASTASRRATELARKVGAPVGVVTALILQTSVDRSAGYGEQAEESLRQANLLLEGLEHPRLQTNYQHEILNIENGVSQD